MRKSFQLNTKKKPHKNPNYLDTLILHIRKGHS